MYDALFRFYSFTVFFFPFFLFVLLYVSFSCYGSCFSHSLPRNNEHQFSACSSSTVVAETTKEDGGLRWDVSCDLTETIVATLQDKWCTTLFAVTSQGKAKKTGADLR